MEREMGKLGLADFFIAQNSNRKTAQNNAWQDGRSPLRSQSLSGAAVVQNTALTARY
jgi:hypothetical protein